MEHELTEEGSYHCGCHAFELSSAGVADQIKSCNLRRKQEDLHPLAVALHAPSRQFIPNNF
jgi:hypothetical protein